MVHHNPGEPPVKSRFLDPKHLSDYGFNGQVFKHINCVATFAASGVDCFPLGSTERTWLDKFTPGVEREITAAKKSGLKVYYHIDLFVLPKRLVEYFKNDICDPNSGRILLNRPKTLELHVFLFDELVTRFPQVDGYIIRVGETYLFDTPHHTGNGPIPKIGPAWTPDYLYEEAIMAQKPSDPRWTEEQSAAYVKLISFLREELCVKHDKQLFFRTWDIFPDKLHARKDHYLRVTNQIEPHPKLAFSIKHTALDFWRHVKVNECLTAGNHPQIIEVQCQREYEGKGAFPNYVMDGVINGFEENALKIGLKELMSHPKILGVYSWSRGGGWYGPYIENEIWPDLNAYVLAQFASNPSLSEADIFDKYVREKLVLQGADITRFRRLCLLSARAILKGRHCTAFDRLLNESILPTALWMRDDRLGGRLQLARVIDYLEQNNLSAEALAEKTEAVQLWTEITSLAQDIHWTSESTREFVKVSSLYGLRLFKIIEQGWRILIAGRRFETYPEDNTEDLAVALTHYAECWEEYRSLAESPLCPSLYEGRYFSLPGSTPELGLDETAEYYRARLESRTT